MSPFCFPLPRLRFLRAYRSRSHSRKPSPAGARDDAPASYSPYSGPSSALPSRSSSAHGAPRRAVDAATDTSRTQALSVPSHLQDSARSVFADGAEGDTSGQPSHFIRPVTPARDEAPASRFPLPVSSSAWSPHPPFVCGAPDSAVDDANVAYRSPLTYPQHFTGRLSVDMALGDTSNQPMRVSRPVTPINVADTNSAPQPAVRLPHLHDTTDSTQYLHPLIAHPQQSLVLERQSHSGEDLLLPPSQHQAMFNSAHNFAITKSNFIDNSISNVTNNFSNSNSFMEKLLKETIPGAAADSSARDPPPRCHPGTRLAILERCIRFIAHCNGEKKMRWVVGAAGVGKSAIMQSVADRSAVSSPELVVVSNASAFFSINGRSDGTKAIMTLSYQFAAKSKIYRQLIEAEVTDNPQLLQSSMIIQFEKFIVQPFIHNTYLNSAGRVLIIIDGLDECSDTRIQTELLHLISNFCLSHPSSPIVWLIASRPEPHIISFFSEPEIMPVFEKEEIVVDSDEARTDVERFLRHELTKIGKASGYLGSQWPDEQDLWKLAQSAGGLFAYAHTAIRYIGDLSLGDPVSQLSDVVNVIDELPLSDELREQHPMALLDALYARILSRIPARIMTNVRKLLLLLVSDWDLALSNSTYGKNLILMCNWLGMSGDEAYAALNRLRSVFDFPPCHEAHRKVPKSFHKSLIDYILRSALFPDIDAEAQQIKTQCAFRVLNEASDGVDFGDLVYNYYYGELLCNDGTCDKISITWRADQRIGWDDHKTQLSLYMLAIGEVVAGIKRGDPVFQSEFSTELLTTRFSWYSYQEFPYRELRDCVFGQSRRREFMKCGTLKEISASAIARALISGNYDIKLQFHCPIATTTLADPWNPSCRHKRFGQWKPGIEQNWTTVFDLEKCAFCFTRINRQLQSWGTRHPDNTARIMFTSAVSCIEVSFVDLEDNVSEWIYWFWITHTLEERKELESNTIKCT